VTGGDENDERGGWWTTRLLVGYRYKSRIEVYVIMLATTTLPPHSHARSPLPSAFAQIDDTIASVLIPQVCHERSTFAAFMPQFMAGTSLADDDHASRSFKDFDSSEEYNIVGEMTAQFSSTGSIAETLQLPVPISDSIRSSAP